jgi:hypothetical protein
VFVKSTFLSKLSISGTATEHNSRVRYNDMVSLIEESSGKDQKSVVFEIFVLPVYGARHEL